MEENDNLQESNDVGSDESAVIAELRKRNREAEKKLAELQATVAEVEAAAQRQRDDTVKGIVDSLGLPGLAEDVSVWVEGEPTVEAVRSALEARSIPLPDSGQPQQTDAPPAPRPSDVGQRVADAAGGVDRRSIDERLAAASSNAELEAIVAEAGLARKHY